MEKKIKDPQDLNAFREKVKSEIDLRTGEKDMRIAVHMGTCGIAAGARDVLAQLVEELQRAQIGNVTVRLSGCIGLCDQEPMLTLVDKSDTEFCYTRLNGTKVREIVHQHVLENQPVVEYMVTTESAEEL